MMADGTEQQQRLPAALDPDYFHVDETRYEDLVAMSAGLAAQLRFYDLHLQPAGTWRELFASDESLVMARIMSIDLGRLQRRFLGEADFAPTETLAAQVVTLAGWLDLWMKSLKLSEEPSARLFRERIEQLIEQQLREDLQIVMQLGGESERTLARLDPIWRRVSRQDVATGQRSDREMLRARFCSFASAIEQLQSLAREQLPLSLQSQSHEPAVALLLAFLSLFQTAQRQINRFTQRHTHFYYNDCLRMQPRAALPDSVHLVCQREPRDRREVLIPRGTRFPAGKDEVGQPIEFAADNDLLVTDARVAALCTLHLERDRLVSPERELDYVTRAKVNEIPMTPATNGTLTDWPLFGAGSTVRADAADRDATMGLAIASSLLLLKEGTREIHIGLHLACRDEVDEQTLQLTESLAGGADDADSLQKLFERYLSQDPGLLGDPLDSPPEATAAMLADAVLRRPELRGGVGGPISSADCYGWFIVELLAHSRSPQSFHRRLGRLFSRWLLSARDWLDEADLRTIRRTARRVLGDRVDSAVAPGDPLSLILGSERPQRELVFDQIFRGLFEVSLSGADGWFEATDVYVLNHADAAGELRRQPQLVVRLRPEDPAIVRCSAQLHGAQWHEELPVLRIELKARSRLYPYSIFFGFLLSELTLAVSVAGVRELALYNNLGRLDASKPFNPFGPLPTLASYLVFGTAEAAAKPLTALRINIEWGNLPTQRGGFAEHYQGYAAEFGNDSFASSLAILRDGVWHAENAPGGTQSLFMSDALGRLGRATSFAVDGGSLRKYHKPLTASELDFGPATRGGFFKLQLTAPADAFGHALYPASLTQTVSGNVRAKRATPLPNPPYTPLIERITLDYRAETTVHLGRQATTQQGMLRILHLHPFGTEQVHPAASGELPALLPRYEHYGNLFIGIAAQELSGPLSLLFHLRDEAASEHLTPAPLLRWAYLADNRWHEIAPANVLADTTGGFLTSGIVTLDVPREARRDNTILPPALFWLRVAADRGFGSFAGLHKVHAQALRATRISSASTAQILPAGRIKQPAGSIAGLLSVKQVGPSFGLEPGDDAQQLRIRTGERLRHKQRAITAWDYERLVLERFSSIFKVKCFPDTATPAQPLQRAQVLVVVIPSGTRSELQDLTLGRRVNAIELQRIEEYLRSVASPFARITVRNAVYEYLQVRCTVKLARGADAGLSIRKINRRIVERLSPWHEEGYGAHFDWTVWGEDVESWIRELDCVDFVTKLSLLHIAVDDNGVYGLGDTARARQADGVVRVRPKSPWSIVMPMRQHIIASVDAYGDSTPEVTGVARLGIGNTFIVGGAGDD